MPARHLLVWFAAGAACWSLIAAAAFLAPQALLALGALLVLPWLRRPAADRPTGALVGAVEPVVLRAPAVEVAAAALPLDGERVLVAQSA
jgi:hypothetical protein